MLDQVANWIVAQSYAHPGAVAVAGVAGLIASVSYEVARWWWSR
jgi:hypothetical protein